MSITNRHLRPCISALSRIEKIERESGDQIDVVVEEYWRAHVNSSVMPRIELIFVGLPSKRGEMPIHDRWWIGKGNGIRLGTSFNGIGKARLTELSSLDSDEMMEVQQKIGGFISRKQTKFDNEKLRYRMTVV